MLKTVTFLKLPSNCLCSKIPQEILYINHKEDAILTEPPPLRGGTGRGGLGPPSYAPDLSQKKVCSYIKHLGKCRNQVHLLVITSTSQISVIDIFNPIPADGGGVNLTPPL